jgi:hypothetical protein
MELLVTTFSGSLEVILVSSTLTGVGCSHGGSSQSRKFTLELESSLWWRLIQELPGYGALELIKDNGGIPHRSQSLTL